MKVDLKGMTRKELEKLRGDIDKAMTRLEAVEKKAALAAAEKAAQAHGFSLAELTGKKSAGAPAAPAPAGKASPVRKAAKSAGDGRAKVAPKYRNPGNAEETWSGRGRAPKWMAAHLAAGGTLEQVLI